MTYGFKANDGTSVGGFGAYGIGDSSFVHYYIGTSYNTAPFVIEQSGQVGIGTITPSYALDVQASGAQLHLKSTTGTNTALLRINNTGGDLYVGRENSAGGGMGTGTTAYASVINSQNAHPLQLLVNNAVAMTILNGGNVGIGTTNPSTLLHIKTATTSIDGLKIDLPAGGTAIGLNILGNVGTGAYPLKIGYSGAEGSLMSIADTGYVGIGTTVPGSKLHIYELYGTGDATLREQLTIERFSNTNLQPGGGGSILFKNRDYAASTTKEVGEIGVINTNGVTGNVDPAMIFLVGEGTPTEKVRIDVDGNVGIGTSGPTAKLEVSSSTAGAFGLRVNGNITAGSSYGVGIYAGTNSSDDALRVHNVSGTEMVRVRGDGYVGIGTNNPGALLHVNGANGLANCLYVTGDADVARVAIGSTTPRTDAFVTTLHIGNSVEGGAQLVLEENTSGVWRLFNNGYLSIYNNEIEHMRIVSGSGNVGIGVTNPDVSLEVNSTIRISTGATDTGRLEFGEADTYFQQTTDRLDIYSYNLGYNHSMTLKGNGYIGIGTTNPSYPLQLENSAQRIAYILGSHATQTYVAIANSGAGKAELIFDASNGDIAGSDYAGIGQDNDLRLVLWSSTSAGNISI
jgi:hypothetical protein